MNEHILKRSELEILNETKIYSSLKDFYSLGDLSKDGPLVLNFILGTWCPLCLSHVQAISSAIQSNNIKIIVVSTESITKLDKEFSNVITSRLNGLTILFCSDSSRQLINMFKLKIPVFGFSKPATFLITNDQVKIISLGIPNKEQTVCDISYYLKQAA